MLTALRHPASADQSAYGGSVPEQRRLLGPGQPLTDFAVETVNSNVLGVVSPFTSKSSGLLGQHGGAGQAAQVA